MASGTCSVIRTPTHTATWRGTAEMTYKLRSRHSVDMNPTCIQPATLSDRYHGAALAATNMNPKVLRSRAVLSQCECATITDIAIAQDMAKSTSGRGSFLAPIHGVMTAFTMGSSIKSLHIPPWFAKPRPRFNGRMKLPSNAANNPESTTAAIVAPPAVREIGNATGPTTSKVEEALRILRSRIQLSRTSDRTRREESLGQAATAGNA